MALWAVGLSLVNSRDFPKSPKGRVIFESIDARARVVFSIATKTFSDPTGNPTLPAARLISYEVSKCRGFLQLERKRICANPTPVQLLANCPVQH